jgi:hypothetical protein
MSALSTAKGYVDDAADAAVDAANWIRDKTAPPKPRSSSGAGIPLWAWAALAYLVLRRKKR